MLRLGKDIKLPCIVCGRPIAPSRLKLHPTVRVCQRRKCNSQGGKAREKPQTKNPTVRTCSKCNKQSGKAREKRVP